MSSLAARRSPSVRLAVAILLAFALTVPLFFVWLLVVDRAAQSEVAQESIAAGWGGPQVMAGPVLVIPYRVTRRETVNDGPTREVDMWEERTVAPEMVELNSALSPERRSRSIYEAIVYEADSHGAARFALPADLQEQGVDPARFDLSRAELRFGLSDARGLGENPAVTVGGTPLRLQPGDGSEGGQGFHARLDARALAGGPLEVRFAFRLRGNRSLAIVPRAGDTRWSISSPWPHPSFQGGFLPAEHQIGEDGFRASYRIGNLALGQSLVSTGTGTPVAAADGNARRAGAQAQPPATLAQIDLVQPVDLYDQVGRATKYGFLFIGFTFLALLLFDIVGGARVRAAEYLLVGAGLVLFFVLLLAFAEVTGFTPAYLIASGAITGLIGSYSAAVLKSRRRAGAVVLLMVTLYGVLYLLLNLEAYSLLIGSVLLFLVLATVMYLTRHIDWGGGRDEATA
jgi:inner membrane protein